MVAASDLVLRYSTTAGSAGDTNTGNGAGSLGKYVAQTAVVIAKNGIFDDISVAEAAALTVDYRCLFLLNNHATDPAINFSLYSMQDVAGGATIQMALDNIAPSAKGSAGAQAAQIANETTAPTGVGAFTAVTADPSGLFIASLPAGQVKAIWFKRTATNVVTVLGDGFALGVSFE